MILSRKVVVYSSPKLGAAWALSNVCAEAESLFRMFVRNGETVESVRELIRIAPPELNALKAFMVEVPELSRQVECAIAFRQSVLKAFERLVHRRNVRPSSNSLNLH